jgi:hypothetical protein
MTIINSAPNKAIITLSKLEQSSNDNGGHQRQTGKSLRLTNKSFNKTLGGDKNGRPHKKGVNKNNRKRPKRNHEFEGSTINNQGEDLSPTDNQEVGFYGGEEDVNMEEVS